MLLATSPALLFLPAAAEILLDAGTPGGLVAAGGATASTAMSKHEPARP